LPERVEARLLGLSARSAGGLMLAVTAYLWLSLLTWSVNDPSLTHPTGAGTGNAGGPVGAILSDITLQMLGFGTVVCLFAPMIWAFELLRNESIFNFRSKAMFYPLSILLMAGAVSTLPVLPGWPLHHAMGGMLGDLVAGLARSTIGAFFGADLGTVVAGLGLFAAGFAAAAHSVGSNAKETVAAAWLQVTSSRDCSSWHEIILSEAKGSVSGPMDARTPPREPMLPPVHPQVEPMEEADQNFDDVDQRVPNGVRGLWDRLSHGFPASSPLGAADGRDIARTTQIEPVGPLADLGQRSIADTFADHFGNAHKYLPGSREDLDFETVGSDVEVLDSRRIASRFAPDFQQSNVEPDLPVPLAVSKPRPVRRPAGARQTLSGPSLDLLKRPAQPSPGAALSQAVARATGQQLMDVLADYGVKGEMRDIKPGPVVTLYEFEPVRGTKSARVIAVADDVARSMSVTSVRAAVVPGRNAIGFELPNAKRESVLLREMLESDSFRTSKAILPLALGKSIGGEPIVADLARMPHLLVAGTTGSGKSVGVNAMILSLLYKHSPDVCRFIMIDPKMLELSVYNGIPHLLTPVVTDPHKAVAALGWAVTEMEERYKRMAALSVRNIEAFNHRVKVAAERGETLARTVQTGFDRTTGEPRFETQVIDAKPMPYIVVVVDEFADLMIVAGKEIEQAVQRLAQMARAAGIHLIMATQRPSVDIITGTIKANFPTRISFKVTSKIDSRTILNEQGAEQLLGQGDMLFSTGAGAVTRVHGPFVSDEEVEAVSTHLRNHGEPDYVEGVTDLADDGVATGALVGARSGGDDLYEQARDIVLRERKASTSYIQRRLSIGYNRAADIIERMEREGLISPASSTGKREVLKPAA
jgi:S-DNA-T family DNA segregation ATPase FtsK/SpoIIIE